MTGHRSVYPSQALSMSKSTSNAVKKGREMSDMEGVDVTPREKNITGVTAKVLEKIRKKRAGST